MSDKPLFSIVIPAWNEEETLPACLACARSQTGGFNYEIIVVDNNSTDRTGEVARAAGARVISESKPGVGAARRSGVAAAAGEYIVNIDADTHLPPDYLSGVFQRFNANEKLVLLSGQFFYYDAPWWKNILRIFVHYILWLFVVLFSRGKIGPMGSNMTFKKSVYDQTTGFDADLKFGEDMDLSRKLSAIGKVRLDMSLHCQVSVRRFGLNRHLAKYFWNFVFFCFWGRPYKNELPHTKDL